EKLREHAQNLANELVALVGSVKNLPRGKPAGDGLVADLNSMLASVQELIRSLPLEPSPNELQQSFRVARRRMGHIEADISQFEWPPEVRRQWRGVRERLNAVSDDLGLPRVIARTPHLARVAGPNRNLVAQVDRSVAWVDEFRAQRGRQLRQTPAGTRFD